MTTQGLERVHDRLDEVIDRLGIMQTDVAVIRAEHAAVQGTVAVLSRGQVEHDTRIASLEHDRSRAFGILTGVGMAGAAGGAGLGAVLRLFGVVP